MTFQSSFFWCHSQSAKGNYKLDFAGLMALNKRLLMGSSIISSLRKWAGKFCKSQETDKVRHYVWFDCLLSFGVSERFSLSMRLDSKGDLKIKESEEMQIEAWSLWYYPIEFEVFLKVVQIFLKTVHLIFSIKKLIYQQIKRFPFITKIVRFIKEITASLWIQNTYFNLNFIFSFAPSVMMSELLSYLCIKLIFSVTYLAAHLIWKKNRISWKRGVLKIQNFQHKITIPSTMTPVNQLRVPSWQLSSKKNKRLKEND